MNIHFARKKIFFLHLLLFSDLFCSCAAYKIPTKHYSVELQTELSEEEKCLFYTYQQEASNHWLYTVIPRHRSQIQWFDWGHWCSWALLGNDDQGVFSEAHIPLFNPQQKVCIAKAFAWMLRNPFHNFCHYVVGRAGYQNDELTILQINRKQFLCMQYNPVAQTVFGGRYTSFYFGLHSGLPLISLRIAYGNKWKSDFYIGWRDRGNFGLKFLPLTKNSLAVWENLNYKD